MDITQALGIAANIMLLGMVCVFVFLGLLVVAIKVLERIAREDNLPVAATATDNTTTTTVDNNVVAAISAAVHQYRRKNLND